MNEPVNRAIAAACGLWLAAIGRFAAFAAASAMTMSVASARETEGAIACESGRRTVPPMDYVTVYSKPTVVPIEAAMAAHDAALDAEWRAVAVPRIAQVARLSFGSRFGRAVFGTALTSAKVDFSLKTERKQSP